jgi:hypothetical protein
MASANRQQAHNSESFEYALLSTTSPIGVSHYLVPNPE